MKPKIIALSAATLAIMLFMFAAPALAEHPAGTLEVAGTGEARTTPDVAYLSLQVETHATSAEQSARKNAALAAKVVAALKSKLAGKGLVTTGNYSLMPEYSEPKPGRKPEIVGYTCQNTITVETGELSLAGALIDTAIAAGANRVNYLNFALRNDTKARNEAITRASHDAQAQAQALAASLGLKLGRVVKASTVPQRPPIVPAARMMLESAKAAVPTPIEPGQVAVTATVSLVYEIE
jgi:uncharacterized protein YggE